MATTLQFFEHVKEKLIPMGGVSFRKMMGEYLLYVDGKLIGGIYDNRLLIKKTEKTAVFNLPEELPYENAKSMYIIDVDDDALLEKIISATTKI